MNASSPSPDRDDVARLYRALWLIRRTEQEIARIYPSDKIKSPVHLSIGQEAVSVGICDVLRTDDAVSGTYRGHAAYLAKGGDVKRMFAELYGKKTGITGGIGGSMHLIESDHGVLGTSAVVGTTIPVAAGHALAFKMEGKGRVVAAFFGDGATEEGVFSETLNFAGLHKLPILFVCENNGYAIHTRTEKRWATDRLRERVATYGMPTAVIEDSDIFAIRERADGYIAAMRDGAGPAFLECRTYRWQEHVGPSQDYDQGYRGTQELDPWVASDQVARVAGMLAADVRERIETDVEKTVADAIAFAETSPFPDPDQVYANVFAK